MTTRSRPHRGGTQGGRGRRGRRTIAALVALAGVAVTPLPQAAGAGGWRGAEPSPVLVGRAVLPVETYAPGPPSGAFFGSTTINGITFPLPSQPVEGFSAIVDGRRAGEYLAMPDNGFGSKANSQDFLIRAYYLRPDFKTAKGGTGAVAVGEYLSFRDPLGLIGFPIVNEGTTERLLTGGDIDPESLQRDHRGDLWVGDEFGPWILHFDRTGVLVEPPFAVPGVRSPNNPLPTGPVTQPNSRGFEAMAISPNGKTLYAALEGATIAEAGTTIRRVFEFDIRTSSFTGREWVYRTEAPGTFVSDMAALDRTHLVVIERDGGLGATAVFRNVYVVSLDAANGATLSKDLLVDLVHIPDPHGVSLPAIHPGDIGIGDPFSVVCESIEAVHPVRGRELILGCDNNFPNTGRNPNLADDNEIIVVALRPTRARGGHG